MLTTVRVQVPRNLLLMTSSGRVLVIHNAGKPSVLGLGQPSLDVLFLFGCTGSYSASAYIHGKV